MTRILMAAMFAAGLTAPALAQTPCEQEVNAIWAAVQESDLDEAQKNQVASVLNGAQEQHQAGEEEACMATVDQVKMALGIEQ